MGLIYWRIGKRGREVLKYMVLDMTFERREEIIRRDERAEGIKLGIEQGIEQGMERGIKQGREQGMDLVNKLAMLMEKDG